MPRFSPTDLLDADNASRLRVIIFYRMRIALLGSYQDLLTSEKRAFNELLNAYITGLPEEDWQAELKREFDEIVLKKILHSDFDASKTFCPEVNTTIVELHATESGTSL